MLHFAAYFFFIFLRMTFDSAKWQQHKLVCLKTKHRNTFWFRNWLYFFHRTWCSSIPTKSLRHHLYQWTNFCDVLRTLGYSNQSLMSHAGQLSQLIASISSYDKKSVHGTNTDQCSYFSIIRLVHGNVIPMGIPWETSHGTGQHT